MFQVFQNILRCNVHSVTNMSLLLMPRMVEKKKGVVINVSSATALFPSPLLTVYGATKVRILSHGTEHGTPWPRRGYQ